ncbi:MAG: hypothetical protein JO171_17790 [Paludibacterium sp.]|uniref:hypothetical protein n=1 Tax=Paludibacterium sp. TaxID=1917523 RepID=UPI0025E9BCFF|nr:hypothetical protein [Paludibacterium sp.]MBV8049006.1 hypothetical protein [Paludibacterium sp.]MBV8647477.1 hypothetical protein [Paludibacterium sp.]
MSDLYHYMGGDLTTSPTGDLALASGVERGKQRLLRRLLTNPGDYLFEPDYGAGLGSEVGAVSNPAQVAARIRGQLALEACVAADPPPAVTLRADNDTLSVDIQYTDAPSGEPTTLSFDVS